MPQRAEGLYSEGHAEVENDETPLTR